MIWMKGFIIFMGSFLVSVTGLIAQVAIPPIITDRPDQSESPYIVPVGHLQIETGFVMTQNRLNGGGKIRAFDLATTLLRYGISEFWEFRLGASYRVQQLAGAAVTRIIRGINGLMVGGKLHLREGEGRFPQTALIVSLNLPVGPDELVPEHLTFRTLLAFTSSITETFSLSYNVGAEQVGRNFTYFFTASFGMTVSDRLGAFAEVYGNRSTGAPAEFHFDTGLTHLLSPAIQLDTSAGFSFTAENWFFNMGLAFRLPR